MNPSKNETIEAYRNASPTFRRIAKTITRKSLIKDFIIFIFLFIFSSLSYLKFKIDLVRI
jgi:hypothetical protein